MKIIVVGTGYVGLVTGTCLADLGNIVTCVDIDKNKIQNLKNGIVPIYEPGLEDLVKRNFEAGRLKFYTNLKEIVDQSEIIIIAVGTPPKENGEADLQYVESVAHEIGQSIKSNKIIINKSTVPIGTGNLVSQIIKQYYAGEFDVISNPEFLREGSAIHDFMQPDRIVLGSDNGQQAIAKLKKMYEPLNCPIIVTDLKSAEMIKYASNSFLAMSISFINSIAQICEKVGADVKKVSQGVRFDKRIGKQAFLHAGCGYGGSCFPKDVQALIKIGQINNHNFTILNQVEEVNEEMKLILYKKLKNQISDLSQKTIGLWGLAFKPNTDDIRFAPAINIIQKLIENNANIRAYDPVAIPNTKKIFPNIYYSNCPYDTAKDCDALLILTDWNEFKQLDVRALRSIMKGNLIIDGRNLFEKEEMSNFGFKYLSIGR